MKTKSDLQKTEKMTYLILVTLMMMTIQQGMTVPGGSHDQEQGDEKQNSLQHRYRHEKRSNERQKFAGLYTGPYFDPAMPNNISVQLGDTALLICKVNQVGRKTVSWIRKRDSHILTVDSTTFISDDRFYIIKPEKTHVWTLRIRYVQPRDAGIYECQVSTEPKMSHFVQLNIVEPTVTIEANDGRIHAHQGSDVEFKCLIKGMLQKPAYVFWYHGDERLLPEYSSSMTDSVKVVELSGHNGRNVPEGSDLESSQSSTFLPDYYMEEDSEMESNLHGYPRRSMYLATLKLNKVRPEQKGIYKCGPSNTKSASAELHITDGEIRAAMSEGTSSSSSSQLSAFFLVLWTMTTMLQYV